MPLRSLFNFLLLRWFHVSYGYVSSLLFILKKDDALILSEYLVALCEREEI